MFQFLAGIQTSQDAKFYARSAKFQPFSNEGKTLILQFTVKHEQKIDCGGGYIKLFPADVDQEAIHGETEYYVMFGEFTEPIGKDETFSGDENRKYWIGRIWK